MRCALEAPKRIRALIEAVELTPERGELVIYLPGELAAMLVMCAEANGKRPPRRFPWGLCRSKWLRGQDLNL